MKNPKLNISLLQSMQSNKSENIDNPITYNTPLIFNKKINKLIFKPLQYITNDTGLTRHYPPGAQEWYNSIYTYNKSLIKTLPIIDKNLMKLLKSYYNMGVSYKALETKRKVNRFRRLSPRKIFVGKGELKHTNSKVIITLYLYNTEKMYLLRELKKQYKLMFLARAPIMIGYSLDREGKRIVSHNRPYTLEEFLETPTESIIRFKRYPLKYVKKILTYREIYFSSLASSINKLTTKLGSMIEYYEYLTTLVLKKLISDKEKLSLFSHKIPNINVGNYPEFNDNLQLAKWAYWKKLRRFFFLLRYNIFKSDPRFLKKLGYMVKSVYNKEVEFNVIELNQMHLNSDIFTQAVALKLKNRKNSLYRVLRSSLTKVDLPNISRRGEKHYNFNRDELLVNRIRNSYINSMLDNSFGRHQIEDSLNKLLLDFYPSSDDLEMDFKYKSTTVKLPVSLETYVLKTLKHLKLAGVRVEAKGRLTKRFTASRSVFKMRWKGGLKNVDSSFKGISAVMLRGIVKSNVQYSLFNSKNRNGAFGVKGWVGSK
uniref:Small ribosomal subunit protein uS3m n=1 Tax=Ceratocystis autographa TaxID=1910946 RepID=A0A1S5RVL1_9PEZI|nr:ribosomal protein S3 [Ceratocystis autographa]